MGCTKLLAIMNSKIRFISFIIAHKILAPPIILAMMYWFHNRSTEAFVYLGLHGTYAVLWLVKSAVYPDKSFQQRCLPLWIGTPYVFGLLATYYIIPYLLLSRHVSLAPWVFGLGVSCYSVGTFLHFVSDAQKYYTLQLRSGLIKNGFFARTRNPNYLGEALTYVSFATLSWHWLSFLTIGGWFCCYFSNMRKKDGSFSRYPDFAAYKSRTGIWLPSITRGFRHTRRSSVTSELD
jgi:protein-S-isoprenylcysteine O-methyltransferase Ste14